MLAQLTPRSGGFCAIQSLELGDERGVVPAIAGQLIGAAEGEPVLVAVDLPDDLVVAVLGVQIRNRRPEAAWGFAVVQRDRGAIVEARRNPIRVAQGHRSGRGSCGPLARRRRSRVRKASGHPPAQIWQCARLQRERRGTRWRNAWRARCVRWPSRELSSTCGRRKHPSGVSHTAGSSRDARSARFHAGSRIALRASSTRLRAAQVRRNRVSRKVPSRGPELARNRGTSLYLRLRRRACRHCCRAGSPRDTRRATDAGPVPLILFAALARRGRQT